MELNADLADVVERAVVRHELVGALELAVGVEREASLVVIACLANGGFGRRGRGCRAFRRQCRIVTGSSNGAVEQHRDEHEGRRGER